MTAFDPAELAAAPEGLRVYVERLQAELADTTTALEHSLAGHPVVNAPHRFAAAANLLDGTEYEFHRRT